MKYVSALEQRLRHLARPHMFRATGAATAAADGVSIGQQVAERVAGSVGSWAFIGAQAAIMALWVLVNTLTFTGTLHFDTYPFVFLNLAMSAEAAFTGPVLLIAANVGAIRDHAQAGRIERLSFESEKMAAQNRELVERLLSIEQLLEEHVSQSLQAHTEELRELGAVIRDVHAVVCGAPAKAASPASASFAAVTAVPAAVPTSLAVGDDRPARAPASASIAEAQPATSPTTSRPRTQRGQTRSKG